MILIVNRLAKCGLSLQRLEDTLLLVTGLVIGTLESTTLQLIEVRLILSMTPLVTLHLRLMWLISFRLERNRLRLLSKLGLVLRAASITKRLLIEFRELIVILERITVLGKDV